VGTGQNMIFKCQVVIDVYNTGQVAGEVVLMVQMQSSGVIGATLSLGKSWDMTKKVDALPVPTFLSKVDWQMVDVNVTFASGTFEYEDVTYHQGVSFEVGDAKLMKSASVWGFEKFAPAVESLSFDLGVTFQFWKVRFCVLSIVNWYFVLLDIPPLLCAG
jgi:hypothetical protein